MVLNKAKCDAMLRSLAMPREDMAEAGDSCGDSKKLALGGKASSQKKDSEKISVLKDHAAAAADSTSEAEIKSMRIPLSDLSERMKQLREKAYKVIEKMSSLPNLSGDVDDFKKEFELMQEMERINSELTNVNMLINVASQNSFKTNDSTSLVESQITLTDLLGSNNEDWQTIKENSKAISPSKPKNVSILRNDDEEDPSSCTRVCEQILLESQMKSSSSQHVSVKKSKSKLKTPCKQNPFKTLMAKLSKSSLNIKKSTKAHKNNKKFHAQLLNSAEVVKYSSALKNGPPSSELNLTLSDLLEDTCDVEAIIKENEFLQNQMASFQQDLEKAKKEAHVYKALLAKEQRKPKQNGVPKPKPKLTLSPNLLKIKNILDSSAALPPFPETIEVLKALCLLLLKKLNDAEDEEQSGEVCKEASNVLIVDSSTKLMLQNSMEILKAIKDITTRKPTEPIAATAEPKKKISPKKSPSTGSQRRPKPSSSSAAYADMAAKPLTAPMEIDFQQFAEKLKQDQQNMKVFVQHIPKKPNSALKTTTNDGKCQNAGLNGCDKIYLVFLK